MSQDALLTAEFVPGVAGVDQNNGMPALVTGTLSFSTLFFLRLKLAASLLPKRAIGRATFFFAMQQASSSRQHPSISELFGSRDRSGFRLEPRP